MTLTAAAGATVVVSGPAWAATPDPVAITVGAPNDGRVLETTGTASGSPVTASAYKVGISGDDITRQRWTLELTRTPSDEDTYYLWRIHNAATGKCLDRDPAAGDVSGAPIIITDCASTASTQQWQVPDPSVEPPVNGEPLINVGTALCLHIAGGNTATGTATQLGACGSDTWQIRKGALSCDRRSRDRIITALCFNVEPVPHFGIFGNWRNNPITFDLLDPAQYPTANAVDNYLTFSSINGNLEDKVGDGVEYGWHSEYDSRNHLQAYSNYWSEWNASTEQYHAVTTATAGAADGRNHSYMVVSNAARTQWDVLFDFNPVGSTTLQEGGRLKAGAVATAMRYPQAVTLPASFADRIQLLSGNNQWERVYLGQTGRSEPKTCNDLPSELDPLSQHYNLPPWCVTTGLGTIAATGTYPTRVDYFEVAKPAASGATGAAPRSVPEPAGPHADGWFNGVDQRKLAACLAGDDTHRCLTEVPGLPACVAAHKLCNLAGTQPAVRPARPNDFAPDQLVAAATARLRPADPGHTSLAPSHVSRATARTVDQAMGTRLASDGDLPVTVVSGDDAVRGLAAGDHGTYRGYSLVYRADDATLLYACLGQQCPRA